MPRGNGLKRDRKNLNLSENVFNRFEKMKAARASRMKTTLSWDAFVNFLILEEIDREKKVAQA
jgi:hypothetical protein